jgi:hypothetical protein
MLVMYNSWSIKITYICKLRCLGCVAPTTMERERIEFLAMLILSAVWIGSAISVPIVYFLLLIGNFAVSCPSTVAGFVEHWNDYTLPRRVFAGFVCVELVCTRLWCIKEFSLVLQSFVCDTTRDTRCTTIFYMWSSICTTLLLDVGIIAWLIFHQSVCADMMADASLYEDQRKLRTLLPLCVQTSSVDVVIEGVHIFNSICMCSVAVFITILSCKK